MRREISRRIFIFDQFVKLLTIWNTLSTGKNFQTAQIGRGFSQNSGKIGV
jgi:hypothetical protein